MAPTAGNPTGWDSRGGSTEAERLDSVLRALSDSTRRQLLYFVKEHRSISFDEVKEKLTAMRGQSSTNAAESTQLEMEAALLHYHLPKLIDVGLIEYKESAGELQYDPVSVDIERIIESVLDCERY